MEPYEGREPYIFISYARKDAERVLPYLDALSGVGYRVWYDKGIKAGADWLDTLLEKVENCEVFCPLFSEAFTDSRYCYLETEWAHRKQKNIVPIYLEEMKQDGVPRLYQLLQSLQDLRLYQFDSPAQFAERLEREQVFAPCKVSEWNKVGYIQWRLSVDGVLLITKNKTWFWSTGSIPPYQYDPTYKGSTAPWAPYRKKIISVEIADDIDAIGDFAFFDCESLNKVRIGNSVTVIGGSAFHSCYNLRDVSIGDSVVEIGKSAFMYCQSLRHVHIPDGVTKISGNAFALCKSLTDIRIPNSVAKIGGAAFYNCQNLKSVEIPAGTDCEYAFDDDTIVTRRDAP